MGRVVRHVVLSSLLCLGGTSCDFGGDSGFDFETGTSGPVGFTFDLTGDWAGTWTSSSGESGSLSIEFLQMTTVQGGGGPSPLFGTSELDGFACAGPLSIEASISPGGFVDAPHLVGTFSDGPVTIKVFALVAFDSTSISGTYEVLEGGACEGDTGTIQASVITAPLPLTIARPNDGQMRPFVVIHGNGESGVSTALFGHIDSETGTIHGAQLGIVTHGEQ